MRFVNSAARSTFEASSAPETNFARAAGVGGVDIVEAGIERGAEGAALIGLQTVGVQKRRQRDLIERARAAVRELRRQHAVAFEHEADEIARRHAVGGDAGDAVGVGELRHAAWRGRA